MSFFKPEELKCKCGRSNCDAVPFDHSSLKKLGELRLKFNQPMTITSGVRCKFQNEKEGGEKESQHLHGKAVDIYCPDGQYLRRLLILALEAGYTGIGIKKRMLHLDTRPGTPVIWGY